MKVVSIHFILQFILVFLLALVVLMFAFPLYKILIHDYGQHRLFHNCEVVGVINNDYDRQLAVVDCPELYR